MKVLSHPGHGKLKCCTEGNWTVRTEETSWMRGEMETCPVANDKALRSIY